jgi:hypothetical protein
MFELAGIVGKRGLGMNAALARSFCPSLQWVKAVCRRYFRCGVPGWVILFGFAGCSLRHTLFVDDERDN